MTVHSTKECLLSVFDSSESVFILQLPPKKEDAVSCVTVGHIWLIG